MIVHYDFNIRRKTGFNTILYFIFRYGLEPVLIQRIYIGFEAICKKHLEEYLFFVENEIWILIKIIICKIRLTSTTM